MVLEISPLARAHFRVATDRGDRHGARAVIRALARDRLDRARLAERAEGPGAAEPARSEGAGPRHHVSKLRPHAHAGLRTRRRHGDRYSDGPSAVRTVAARELPGKHE